MYFNNGYESTYEELISYYPNFYRKVFELKAILEAHGRICDNIIDTINAVLKNSFINSADATMITRLEAFLGITTDISRPLEERRSLVYAHFVGFGKISASKIKEIIKAFTGADSTISFVPIDDAGNYSLVIEIDRGGNTNINFTDINKTLANRLPAHIAYDWAVKYKNAVVAGPDTTPKHYIPDIPLCGTLQSGAYPDVRDEIPTVHDYNNATLGKAELGLMVLGVPYESE